MGIGRGRALDRESFFSREEGEESAMGVERGHALDRESFDRNSMPPQVASLAELSLEDKANIIHNLLLNVNDDCRRVIIIKLVSDSEIRRSIDGVLHSVPIEQAT